MPEEEGEHAQRAAETVGVESKLLAARRALAESERLSALGMLVSGVAHEVRTPLAYIATNLHLARLRLERLAESGESASRAMEEVGPRLDDALQGVDRINVLVLELRRFAKTSRSVPIRTSLDVPVGSALRVFRPTLDAHVALVERLAPTVPVVVEPSQLQQVVLNLVENAVEAARSRVTIVTREENGEAVLEVEDDGPGMPPDVQARAFEAFFTTKPEGLGLGLAIVRRIVEAHRGAIAVASGGGGTTIKVTIPAAD